MQAWDGKWIWIWELDATDHGNLQQVIDQVKRLGARGVILKSHDGETVWPQFAQAVKPFQQAGLAVAAWGYWYPQNLPAQVRAVADAFSHGADWYVIDAEVEWYYAAQAAQELGKLMRAQFKEKTIGLAPLAIPQYHAAFPYGEFAQWVDVMMPQLYWAAFGGLGLLHWWGMMLHGFANFHKPLAPIGQAYGRATAADIILFGHLTAQYQMSGMSFWDLQSASSDQLNAIAFADVLKEGVSSDAVRLLQDLLNHTGAHLVTDGVFGPLTTQAVKRFEAQNHLTVDGIVGPLVWSALYRQSETAGTVSDIVRPISHQTVMHQLATTGAKCSS